MQQRNNCNKYKCCASYRLRYRIQYPTADQTMQLSLVIGDIWANIRGMKAEGGREAGAKQLQYSFSYLYLFITFKAKQLQVYFSQWELT